MKRHARERLAADPDVAAMLAVGDPAAECGVRALALNGGNLARALVGLAQAMLHVERHVSRGMLRGQEAAGLASHGRNA